MSRPVRHAGATFGNIQGFLIACCFAVLVTFVATNVSGCGKKGTAGTPVQAAAPDVTFQDLQGNRVPLSSLKGKMVLVNFWATWCEPCRVEIPWMIDFQHKYGSRGFTMLGVAMDDEGKKVVDPFIQKTQFDVNGHRMTMDYPVVLGNDDITSKFGGLIGLPTSVLISRDGKVIKRYIGLVNQKDLEKEIQSQL